MNKTLYIDWTASIYRIIYVIPSVIKVLQCVDAFACDGKLAGHLFGSGVPFYVGRLFGDKFARTKIL